MTITDRDEFTDRGRDARRFRPDEQVAQAVAPGPTMTDPTTDLMRTAVDRGDLPCVVGVAADARGSAGEWTAGPTIAGGDEPVGADSVFRLASMTKIVTSVAALQLRDRGLLDLDAPVEHYDPAFAGVRVLDGFGPDGPRLRLSASRATVRQLLTHTSGLADGYWNEPMSRWNAAAGPPDLIDVPMMFDPGTRFEYGLSVDWLGRVVESIGGQTLDAHLAEHILAPLRMSATTFAPTDEQRARCVPVHVRGRDGTWEATGFDWPRRPDRWAGGHGLYSTPQDFLRFLRMLLGGGTLDGVQVLSATTVREMFINQVGALDFPALLSTVEPSWCCDIESGPDRKWGWGLQLTTRDTPRARRAGSGSWMGMFNTYFWVDPAAGVAGALFSQCQPLATPEVLRVYRAFEEAVYATAARREGARSGRSSIGTHR
jgi:methyl acetate hydrolase